MSAVIGASSAKELEDLTANYRAANSAFERHRDAWQEAIVNAVDEGIAPAHIAAIVGVTPQRIVTIIERVYRLREEHGANWRDVLARNSTD